MNEVPAAKAWETRRSRYGDSGARKNPWITRREKYGPSGQAAPKAETAAKGQETRRAKYGPSGLTEEGRKRRQAQCATINPKKDTCRRGHLRTEENTFVKIGKDGYEVRVCRPCERIRWQRKYIRMTGGANIVPAGMTGRSLGTKKAWITTREKHGEKGYSPEELERRRERGRIFGRLARQPKRTHCRRGHLYTPTSVKTVNGRRTCKVCADIRQRGRPRWVDTPQGRIAIDVHDEYFHATWTRLRGKVIESHPDKGGTNRQFRMAREAEQKFLAAEKLWYAKVDLPLPDKRLSAA